MISIYLLPDLHTFQSSTHFAPIFPSHIIFAPFFLSLFRCTHYLHPLFCSISSFILQKKEYDWGRLLAKTEHSHPLGMVVSTHFRCGKGVKRGLKNGALVSVSAMLVSMRQKKSLKFLFLSDIFLFPPIRQQVPILA